MQRNRKGELELCLSGNRDCGIFLLNLGLEAARQAAVSVLLAEQLGFKDLMLIRFGRLVRLACACVCVPIEAHQLVLVVRTPIRLRAATLPDNGSTNTFLQRRPVDSGAVLQRFRATLVSSASQTQKDSRMSWPSSR